MPKFTRVKDKRTGYHLSVGAVHPKHHEVLKQEAVDSRGNPLPPKFRTSVDKAGEDKKAADQAGKDKS